MFCKYDDYSETPRPDIPVIMLGNITDMIVCMLYKRRFCIVRLKEFSFWDVLTVLSAREISHMYYKGISLHIFEKVSIMNNYE